MVPIRDVVIFPFTKVAFKIGRAGSVRALEQALAADRTIFLATQHDATVDEPGPDQIYGIGTLGRILQSQKQENGQIKVVVEGRERATTVPNAKLLFGKRSRHAPRRHAPAGSGPARPGTKRVPARGAWADGGRVTRTWR